MSVINDLLEQIQDYSLRERLSSEFDKLNKQKKFGLVFEEHLPECTPLYDIPVAKGNKVALKAGRVSDFYTVLKIENGNALCLSKDKSETKEYSVDELVTIAEFGEPIYPYLKLLDSVNHAPDSDLWHILIESDNYHALQLLEYLYAEKVDCIYIDPPYNSGARDWKYNNDYVDNNDQYRHSKWLSMMQKRLKIAKKLLNPKDSVLIITIDEKEYLHLGCLLEEMFPEARIQMITDIINPGGTNRENEFSRVEEYVYFCQFGASNIKKTGNNMLNSKGEEDTPAWLAFNRSNNPKTGALGQFYPIYIDEKAKKIIEIGEASTIDIPQSAFPKRDGLTSVFPVRENGDESIWRAVPQTAREWLNKGYIRVSKFDSKHNRWTLQYIPSGIQSTIESGALGEIGRRSDGSLNIKKVPANLKLLNPKSVWYQKHHNADDYGGCILKDIIPKRHFSYPKSLYSTADALRFFISNKPNAIVIDFFAGSGTTLHAVNLLNSEDGGNRRCILVTNNEVSDAEAKEMSARGLKPGDEEWEKLGIARYITWPRTVCSIEGHDVNGNPLQGNYIGSDLPMADGFNTNAIFFKLGFLDKTKVSLGMQFKELLPALWIKADAIGECPTIDSTVPDMLILPRNKFAVLLDEKKYLEFVNKLEEHPEIKTVYIVTDSESSYRDMISNLNIKNSYQLYRDYLDNFLINSARR